MLNFNSILIGSDNTKLLGEFYKKVFGRPADMEENGYYGWQVGKGFLTIGDHSQIHGKAKEPERIILNLETSDVQGEFDRIVKLGGATVIKEPYSMSGDDSGESGLIATFADPDGNFFQLMSPWESTE